jgi:hypothetical protein
LVGLFHQIDVHLHWLAINVQAASRFVLTEQGCAVPAALPGHSEAVLLTQINVRSSALS